MGSNPVNQSAAAALPSIADCIACKKLEPNSVKEYTLEGANVDLPTAWYISQRATESTATEEGIVRRWVGLRQDVKEQIWRASVTDTEWARYRTSQGGMRVIRTRQLLSRDDRVLWCGLSEAAFCQVCDYTGPHVSGQALNELRV